jgi:predicted NAD/FAD-binding protein
MSFCASINDGQIEYGLNSIPSLLAQKTNLIRPQFYRMIRDIIRFGQRAEAAANTDAITIADLIDNLGLSRAFRDWYLLPMCGAIWSTPVEDIDGFPAKSLVRFFRNHALLAGSEKRQWWTVKGGSIEYVTRLETALRARGVTLHLNAPVSHAARADGVTITAKGAPQHFDQMILACHSDQALAILGPGATPAEHQALSAVRYQPNRAVLHADPGQMPRRRACWASWAYQSQQGNIGATYWMNRLQNIPDSDPLFVTLNPARPIRDDLIYDVADFAHPVFDRAALAAQRSIRDLQGQNNTWFAGAWNRHGFHEDGIASAMRIVRALTPNPKSQETQNAPHVQSPETPVSFDLRTPA